MYDEALKPSVVRQKRATITSMKGFNEEFQNAVHCLIKNHKKITIAAIAELIEVSHQLLLHNPKISTSLLEAKEQHYAALKGDILNIVEEYKKQRIPISQRNVAEMLGISVTMFRRKPELAQIIRDAKEDYCVIPDIKRDLLNTIEECNKRMIHISQRFVAKALRVPRSLIQFTPELACIVREAEENQRSLFYEALKTDVLRIIEEGTKQEIQITHGYVARRLKISRSTIHRRPELAAIIREAIENQSLSQL